jgi:5-aminolevulinate synthase
MHRHVGLTKQALRAAGLPLMETPSHIVPVMIGNANCARAITDGLLDDFGIYVQPINYPTVPRGTERLRLTPGPFHGPDRIERLVEALDALFSTHKVEFKAG